MTTTLRILMSCLLVAHPILDANGIFYEEISEGDGNTIIEDSMQRTSIIHRSFHACSMEKDCKYVIKQLASGKFTLYNRESGLPLKRTGLRIWKKTYHDINECDSHPCANGGICEDRLASFKCTCAPGYTGIQCQIAARSCLDLYRHGKQQNAVYEVFDQSNHLYKVLCDFETDSNRVWTLITSFSLSNKDQYKVAFLIDYPRNENNPNWVDYRLSFQRMRSIRSLSKVWRATCSFPTYKFDITRDYVRARIQVVDILNYFGSSCKAVEYINIRGHNGSDISVGFYLAHGEHFHSDSYVDHGCSFNARQGSTYQEDNFGMYNHVNPAFRCTESPESTTQYWFGTVK